MQQIYNIAEICLRKGIKEVVLSPGSRCAPLTLAFVRHPEIKTFTISDERSAAFIGIGISQQTERTVALVCTSGSAAYNYAPAVAEAYYQHIPLLILTADRPPEWIDQQDGQTIRQYEIYGKHVKESYILPVDYAHADSKWEIERIVNEAINLSQQYPAGPVHINIPLREPLYSDEEISFDKNVKIIENIEAQHNLDEKTWAALIEKLHKTERKLIVAGQLPYDETLVKSIPSNIAFISDTIANFHSADHVIKAHDIILSQNNEEVLNSLAPDILITFGNSVISKNLKLFLRKNKPKEHWHIQEAGHVPDVFQSLTKIISVAPSCFLQKLKEQLIEELNYYKNWQVEEQKAQLFQKNFFEKELVFSEFAAIKFVMQSLPENSLLHLSNSMPVRYANYIGLTGKNNIEVFANRGTSGIDGVISTAFGAALSTKKIVTVLTGDMAFMYDRNAFWNNYMPKNLRIVILNNHGGGIFRILDGSNKQPELDEYFETRQALTAENIAKDHELDYLLCNDINSLKNQLKNFFSSSEKSKILEIETDSKTNTKIFQEFKNLIKNNYE